MIAEELRKEGIEAQQLIYKTDASTGANREECYRFEKRIPARTLAGHDLLFSLRSEQTIGF